MDWQALFNVLAGILGVLFGWILSTVWGTLSNVVKEVSDLRVHLPENYISKPDFQDFAKQILARLDKIQDTVSAKQDRERL